MPAYEQAGTLTAQNSQKEYEISIDRNNYKQIDSCSDKDGQAKGMMQINFDNYPPQSAQLYPHHNRFNIIRISEPQQKTKSDYQFEMTSNKSLILDHNAKFPVALHENLS